MAELSAGERHHQDFMRREHERRLTETAVEANAKAAELIGERIAAKLAEQNDIILRIGQKQGRTSLVAYISLFIGGIAALGQLLGPVWEWPIFKGLFG